MPGGGGGLIVRLVAVVLHAPGAATAASATVAVSRIDDLNAKTAKAARRG